MAKHQNRDDLFEGSTMTFGEHIEELRSALFQALGGLAVAFVITLFFADTVVHFIDAPLRRSLEKHYRLVAEEKLRKQYGAAVPPEMLTLLNERGMIPKKMHIELDSLLANLRSALPERFSGIDVDANHFASADFLPGGAATLARRWQAGAKQTESFDAALWHLLSPVQRKEVERIAVQDTANGKDLDTMVGILNSLVQQRGLSSLPAMEKDLQEGGEKESLQPIKASLEKRFDAQQSRRLNRLLLASHYPEALRRPGLTLVEISTWEKTDVRTTALNAHEAFMIWVKSAMVVGVIVAAPWIFWRIWHFVAAGLYPHERRYVYVYLPVSIFLFLGGAALAFFFVFDYVLNWLFEFNRAMNIDPLPRIGEYLNFVLILPLMFGLSFQLPLVMLFLHRIGLFTVQQYLDKWRVAILVIFVISMILTPADPISMLLMAVPLSFLYFGGVAMCQWMPKGRNPFAEMQPYEP